MKYLLLILLLLPSWAWGATHYVQKIGTTWKRLQDAWPTASTGTNCANSNSVQGCINDLSGSGHTIILYPGTYSGTDLRPSAPYRIQSGATNTEVRQPISTDAAYVAGDVVIDGTASTDTNPMVSVTHTGWTLGPLTIANKTQSGQYGLQTSAAITTNGLTIRNCDRGWWNTGGGTMNRLIIKNIVGKYVIYFGDTGLTTNVNDFIIDGAFAASPDGYVTSGAAQTVNFSNGIFTGFQNKTIAGGNDASTWTFNNVIFTGNGMNQTGSTPIINTGGAASTWTFNNCLLSDSPWWSGSGTAPLTTSFILNDSSAATITASSTASGMSPAFRHAKREGRTFAMVDDSGNYNVFKSLVTLANTYGYKVGLSVSHYGNSSINWSELAGYVNSGHYVACHAWSHVRHLASLAAFGVTKTGITITIAQTRTNPDDSTTWSGTLRYQDGTPTDETLTLSDTGDLKTVKEVVTYLAGHGVTIGVSTSQVDFATDPDNGTKSTTLAAGTYSTGGTLTFDQTSLFQVEITEAKAWLEAQMQAQIPGWTAKSFVWPGGYSYTAAQTAVQSAGFAQARSAANQSRSLLYALNLFAIDAMGLDSYQLGNPTTQSEAAGMLDALAQTGAVAGVFRHGVSSADWTAFFSAVAQSGVGLDTLDNVGDWIRANDDHVTGLVSYKCSDGTSGCFVDASNYRLKSSSPCKAAGTSVGLTTDLAGKAWKATPSIGAYQYFSTQTGAGFGFHNFGFHW